MRHRLARVELATAGRAGAGAVFPRRSGHRQDPVSNVESLPVVVHRDTGNLRHHILSGTPA